MQVSTTKLPGVLLFQPKRHGDDRGFFMEVFREAPYLEAGAGPFVQDNVSLSSRGVLRGLHAQNPNPQGKLVMVLSGEIYDVAVDIRVGSPTFAKWVGVSLSSENAHQLY